MQQSGSEEAFEQLYTESKRGVYSFIYSYVPNSFDAEDLTEQTYINVRSYVDRYLPGSNPLAWILQIAKNNCLNFIKRNKNEVTFTDAEKQVSHLQTETIEVGGQILDIIRNSLSEDEQKIVIMHLVTGLKHREIAEELDMPIGTVLWKYNKAIKYLQGKIKKEYYEN